MRPWLFIQAITGVAALQGTSPFILLSNGQPLENLNTGDSHELSVDWLESEVLLKAIESCPFNAYVFVNQPEVSERDISKTNTPFLDKIVKSSKSRELFATIAQGEKYQGIAEDYVLEHCNVQKIVVDPDTGDYDLYHDTGARILTLDFANSSDLSHNDEVLNRAISKLASGNFFISYRTTPKTREIQVNPPKSSASGTIEQKKYESLFENYQFFSPGIFMSTIVSGLIVGVLLIALKAVNSLSITTKAFEKPPSIKN